VLATEITIVYVTQQCKQINTRELIMDLEKAKLLASGDQNNTETITFRIDSETKARFVEVCKEHNLSIGRLMRAVVNELIEDAKG